MVEENGDNIFLGDEKSISIEKTIPTNLKQSNVCKVPITDSK